MTHAEFGPVTGWTYGNGRQLQRPLDLDYRPQAVHDPAAGGLSLSYGYDPVGSITELKNGTGTSFLAKYAYDTLGRLTQTKDGATDVAIETYAYDATGNGTALTMAAGTASYTYPLTATACSPLMARRAITTRQVMRSALAARRSATAMPTA